MRPRISLSITVWEIFLGRTVAPVDYYGFSIIVIGKAKCMFLKTVTHFLIIGDPE